MKLWRSSSLRVRLIIRLVLVQALALVLVSGVGIWGIVMLYGIEGRVADHRDAAIIDAAITRTADGALALAETPDMAVLLADAPGLWFVAADEGGNRVEHGTVPEGLAPLAAAVTRINGSHVRDGEANEGLSFFVRVFDRAEGRIHVMMGGGRSLELLPAMFVAANRFLLGLFAVLAIATTVLIPWIIRREVRGVEAVAAQANMVDIDKRGGTLSAENLPSEIAPLVNAFNAALERLDRGYQHQERFLAAAAHELKTPIAILQTRIETTVEGPARAALLVDVARLTTLAEQLLDVERVKSRHEDWAPTDLVALARQVTADLAPLAIASGYEIAFETDAETVIVRGDAPALERALTNLVQNAMMHGGGAGTIGVSVGRSGAIEVSDQGPGVPAAHRHDIFEPFHRVRPMSRGAGLGLSLVSDIARLHKGAVSVSDAPDGGAIFRLTVPPHRPAGSRADPVRSGGGASFNRVS